MRREYVVSEVLNNFTGNGVKDFEWILNQRCWIDDDTIEKGNKLIVERKCKDPFALGVINNVKVCEDCILVRTDNETFRFESCDLNHDGGEILPMAEDVATGDGVVGGISIKVNVDTSEIDAAIEKLERLIKLSTMIPSRLLNNE